MMLMTGFIVVLLFAYSTQFPKMQKDFDTNYKNIEITFFDRSIQKENPSGKVKIDGQVVHQIDSISNSLYQDTKIYLKKGKHIIEISTIDDQYKLIDTIEVIEYPMTYMLWIQFNYNPPLEEYKKVVIDHTYQKSIKGNSYSDVQRADLLMQVEEKINKEFENGVIYELSNRLFTFSFKDITHFPIE